jgi:hypothetical protein
MDDGACGYYRVKEPIRVARDAGVDAEWFGEVQVVATKHPSGATEVHELLHDCDVLILQRPLMQAAYAVALAAKRQGIKIVVELDDDLHAVHKRNTVEPSIDPKKQPWHNRDWAARTIALADLLTVSTPALARYGPEKAVVVRNRLPASALTLRPDVSPARRVVGWTGSIGVHPADLQSTEGGLNRVPGQFTVVGDARGVAEALKLPPSKVALGAEWDPDIPSYWKRVAENIGVGVAPLEMSPFNQAKSDLKCREYLNLGIPFVASPTDEYKRIVAESGAGLIATSRGQWGRMVNRLVNNDAEYERLRQRGADWAPQNTIEQHAQAWIDAWERAYNKQYMRDKRAGLR